jgi:RNA polymerase sigma-70 factor (ECF subfamily)
VIDIVLEPIAEIEEALVIQAKGGDRNAYGELVGRCYEDVIRVVYRLCGDNQVAQDATQEAFMRAWVKLPGFQSRAPFSHWVYRIAVNIALDMLREKPQESIEAGAEISLMAETGAGPEAAYLQKEQADLVQGAVNALPDAARLVLVLREYGDLSYEEIASLLEIPVGTVMSRLNYARNRLREMLRKDHLETEREYA